MGKCFFVTFGILLTLLVSCGNDSSSSKSNSDADNDDENIPNQMEIPPYLTTMVLVEGSDNEIILGTNNKNALVSERPQMKVALNYDFYMDKSEVTCGEYVSVLKTAKKEVTKCNDDEKPIVDVTYYDAILWANIKSNIEGVDTVYDYVKATFDDEGHCTYINGLVFHPEREGFRLPTEAEWIKAASVNWDSTNSWNSSNSDYELHKTCSLDQDSSQFCDLAGNVMEWVNDWLGNFKDTTVTNYVGAPDGGDVGERILKGGSFINNEASINRYSRGDVYTVTSSTRAEYVGFRLAYGIIKAPLWLSNNGKAQESIVNVLADPTEIYKYTKSYNIKLAFRNDETSNLAFIDYTTGAASVIEIADTISVYHPEISPNGSHVAFCTGMEGISGKSSLYVRDLNEEGSNLVKLDVKTAAIPRWKVLENGDTIITYVTDAGSNKDSITWKNYSTWQVPFNNGQFGKPVKLYNGSFHGGISEDNTLAVSGAQVLRVKIADKDENITPYSREISWYNGEQACNVSLAQDFSKRTAFLDFASQTGKDFVGERYRVHQRLFIADSNGKLIQSVNAPSGYNFDHSEWAVGDVKDNLVATLTNSNGAHKRITLISLKDSTTLDLAEGEELWHPSFWVKKKEIPVIIPSDTTSSDDDKDENDGDNDEKDDGDEHEEVPYILDLDSAGAYFNSTGDYVAAIWRYKMEILWQYKDSANVVVLGSSRALLAVMPLLFNEPFFAINLANHTNIKHGSKYVFHNYVIPHVKNLKYVIISMDIDRWYHDDNYSFFYETYKSFPGYIYDANHNFWAEDVPNNLFDVTYQSLGREKYATALRGTRGFYATSTSGWEQDNVPLSKDSSWLEKSDTIFNKHYQHLVDIVAEAYEHNITVIGVEFPESPAYQNTGSYGKYGIKRSQMPMIFKKIQQISEQYPNFIFFDENQMGAHDYTDEMAQNADHLAPLGAEHITVRLDSLLRKFLPPIALPSSSSKDPTP